MLPIVPSDRYRARVEQAPFHLSRAPIRFLRGGVGAGKTIAGAAEALNLAAENPGLDGMVIAPTWSILQRVTLREVLRLLPKSRIRVHRKQERYVELRNSSCIYYGSADRPETLEGSNLAWAWGDEARYWRREAWQILLARVRHPAAKHRSIVLTSTPSMGWLYEEFGQPRPDAESWAMPTHTNPYLPPEYLESLRRRYSPRLYRQYCEGAWVLLEGAVFEEFDAEKQIQPLEVVRDLPVHAGVDFGYRRSAAVFFQHIEHCNRHGVSDCLHILDEVLPDNRPTPKLAEVIQETIAAHNWILGKCYCDPAGSSASVESGYSSLDVFDSYGIPWEYNRDPENVFIPNGIESIRGKLCSSVGKCSLYIHPRVQGEGHERGIVAALQQSAYPEAKDGRPVEDKPVKDGLYDHALDALRYAVINLFPSARTTIRLPW